MSGALLELHKAQRDSHQKYTYFLLTAAGAAIGFAVTQTQHAALHITQIPLGAAVFLWATSFYCGCNALRETGSLMQQNYELLRVEQGLHPRFPNDPNFVSVISNYLEELSNKSGRWSIWQFRLLIGGAVLFILWHIIEMYLRTA